MLANRYYKDIFKDDVNYFFFYLKILLKSIITAIFIESNAIKIFKCIKWAHPTSSDSYLAISSSLQLRSNLTSKVR